MALPSRFTKVKIAAGYFLLLAALLFTLFFVRRELGTLSASDDQQNLRTDSLLVLLREKDQNTIRMLRVLNESNSGMLSTGELEEIIAGQDSVIVQQRVQSRVITKRDSLITKPRKKGFFKRLAEAFVPSKGDTAVLLNTSLELATDTILESYNPTDSLHQKIRTASRQKSEKKKTMAWNDARYHRLDVVLTARIDSLIQGYEQGTLLRAQQEAELQQEVRRRSTQTIGAIAIGGVLLAGFFLILILRDVTRSNRYRRQLEEANRRAGDLLEAREKLMLAITHDFKAPLGSIMGYTDLLTGLSTDQRQRFYLDNMKSSSAHLLKLVSDLLDFHRLDLNKAEVNRVSFHPAQLFTEIQVSFQPLATTKGLELECHIAPELEARFVSDPLRIRQIVNNLLSNAVKFTAQGSVTLDVSYHSSRLCIAVTDTGKGMAPEDRERIFQEFTRLPGAQGEEGFGLGLSIVHKLVALLEGEIDVRSTQGEGSCFIITLPLYPVGEALGTKKEEDTPLSQAKKILLIDDDRIQLTLTSAMLEQQGIHATCCQQLDELTEQLRTHVFDLLLTDVQMPAINGFDLLKLLRASNIPQARAIPIIAVTARSEMNVDDFLAHGFAGCLHKPFTVKELLGVMGGVNVESAVLSEGNDKDPSSLHFSALTAFSEGDPEAAASIIHTFIEETEKNVERMDKALLASDTNGVAAMAHKLLPLFTLVGARQAVELLTWLESRRNENFSDEIGTKTEKAMAEVRQVLAAALLYSTRIDSQKSETGI